MASTTRKSKAARADRKTEIETRLHEAIVTLVAEGESFTELSVERLVAEAGMARSTFYVYFEDKGALLRALGATSLHGIYDGARPWFEKNEVTREDVQTAMRAILEAFRADEVIMTAVAETAVYDLEVRDMYRRSVEDFVTSLRKHIQRGQKQGVIRDVSPAETAAALSWMIERTTLQRAPGASAKTLDSVARGLTDVVWNALYRAA
jgi:AcrR family transcriptional regulator